MNTEEKKENLETEENNNQKVADTELPNNEASNKENAPEDKLKNQITELNDKVLRLLAENQNLRKNHEKEKEDIIKY